MAKKSLGEKELLFVHQYVSNGFNGTAAYAKAYEISEEKKDTAAAGAYRLLKNQSIQEAIDIEEGSYKALAREMEMDRKEILNELKRIVWGKAKVITKTGVVVEMENDGKTKNAAITTLCKLIGDFSSEKREIDFTTDKKIDTKNLTEEEIKALQATLLGEM